MTYHGEEGGGGCEAWSEALIVVVYSVKLIL